jgi:predicted Rossmann fold nucleotide-binding protein DprA/Smf involved in DNA uptake
MTRLLITGSRDISKAGIDYAKAIVARAKELDWSIIVGDASGVDTAVIDECDRLGVRVTVQGAYGILRHRTITGENRATTGSYVDRDRLMAEACDVCMAIWNGNSHGTEMTFKFAQSMGKTVHIKRFIVLDDSYMNF